MVRRTFSTVLFLQLRSCELTWKWKNRDKWQPCPPVEEYKSYRQTHTSSLALTQYCRNASWQCFERSHRFPLAATSLLHHDSSMLLSLDVRVVQKVLWAGIHRDWRACRTLSNNRKKAGRLMLRSWFQQAWLGNIGNCAWSASTAVQLALSTGERRDRASRAWKVVGQITERVVLPEVRNWHGQGSCCGKLTQYCQKASWQCFERSHLFPLAATSLLHHDWSMFHRCCFPWMCMLCRRSCGSALFYLKSQTGMAKEAVAGNWRNVVRKPAGNASKGGVGCHWLHWLQHLFFTRIDRCCFPWMCMLCRRSCGQAYRGMGELAGHFQTTARQQVIDA